MNRLLYFIKEPARLLIGLVFILSGLAKAIDPLGTSYKIVDYLQAFHLPFISQFGLVLSFIFFALEFLVGFLLIMNIYRQKASFVAFILMLFFTPLTLYIALANPVTDCGCFGDALHISNWQTFSKNLLFLPLSFFLWKEKDVNYQYDSNLSHKIYALIASLFILSLGVYSFVNIPLIDFRPYHIGTHIPSAMVVPEGAPLDKYETLFIYEKDGVKKEFSEDNYPWQDSTWHYVDSKSTLIEKGYVPPIHDFIIESSTEGDVTERILSSSESVIMIVSYRLDKADDNYWKEINELYMRTLSNGSELFLLTASSGSVVAEYKQKHELNMPVYTMDEIAIKTVIRSNPGVVILKEGVIIDKFPANKINKIAQAENLLSQTLSICEKDKNKLILLSLFLAFAGVLLAVKKRI